MLTVEFKTFSKYYEMIIACYFVHDTLPHLTNSNRFSMYRVLLSSELEVYNLALRDWD